MAKMASAAFNWDAFNSFVAEFKDESDRAAVILGVAKLDLALYQLLTNTLLPATGKSDELLDGDSPLGTFSAKIAFAFRLGLIDAQFTRALHLARKIRNDFAHEASGVSLSAGAHRDRVSELFAPFRALPSVDAFQTHFFKNSKGPAIDFRTALAIMVARLENLANRTEVLDKYAPLLLIPPTWKLSAEERRKDKVQPEESEPQHGI